MRMRLRKTRPRPRPRPPPDLPPPLPPPLFFLLNRQHLLLLQRRRQQQGRGPAPSSQAPARLGARVGQRELEPGGEQRRRAARRRRRRRGRVSGIPSSCSCSSSTSSPGVPCERRHAPQVRPQSGATRRRHHGHGPGPQSQRQQVGRGAHGSQSVPGRESPDVVPAVKRQRLPPQGQHGASQGPGVDLGPAFRRRGQTQTAQGGGEQVPRGVGEGDAPSEGGGQEVAPVAERLFSVSASAFSASSEPPSAEGHERAAPPERGREDRAVGVVQGRSPARGGVAEAEGAPARGEVELFFFFFFFSRPRQKV